MMFRRCRWERPWRSSFTPQLRVAGHLQPLDSGGQQAVASQTQDKVNLGTGLLLFRRTIVFKLQSCISDPCVRDFRAALPLHPAQLRLPPRPAPKRAHHPDR